MPAKRTNRVGALLQTALAELLLRDVKDPRVRMVTVTGVDMSPDLKHARVFVSVPHTTNKEQTDAIKALEHASGFIRRELVERLQLRRVPDLHFTLDLSQEHVERIEQLLKEVKKEKPASSD